jgi:2-amino-4-hydroxy-6-hydroxymethyldihydropteridine diphosphokinase
MCLIINTLVEEIMSRIYLSLGSNLGYRQQNLDRAIALIGSRTGEIERRSGYYESDPWGFSSENHFFNCCLMAQTSTDPLLLMDQLLLIEKEIGRKRRDGGYSDRLIDIDLLMYDAIQMDHPRLTLPHPGMENRKFVLLPLAEIAPELIHPVTGISVARMLQLCPDQTRVIPVFHG